MKVTLERSMKYLAVVVTIAFASVFATTVVNAAPNLQENTPVDETETAPDDYSDFGVVVLNGTVASIDSETLTIVDSSDASFVASFDEYTVVFDIANQSEVAIESVTAGDLVEVVVIENTDNERSAEYVSILPEGESIRGEIAEVIGSTIIVTAGDTDYAVTTDAETTFFVDSVAASLSDIVDEMNVQAYGTMTAEGALSADLIIAHQSATTGPIETDVTDLGRQRDTSETVESEPTAPPDGYSVDRTRDEEVPAAAAVAPPGGYSVDRQRDP